MLRREGIQFQNCKNPDVKCSVIEGTTARSAINYINSSRIKISRFVDVLPHFEKLQLDGTQYEWHAASMSNRF